MQEKDAYNPNAGYPALPAADGASRAAPPPYSDYPQPGYPQPGYPLQGTPGYPPEGGSPGYPHPGYQPATVGYPHPPGTQIHIQGPNGVTTVVPGAAVVIQPLVGAEPTRTTCRNCQQEMVTRTETRSTMKTHLMALFLCLLGCWPCVCVPYCMDSCLDVDHTCSKCGAFVGSYSR